MRRCLIALLVFPLLAWAGPGGDFEAGLKAYRSGDYAAALKHWKPLAEQGNALAQNNLAVMHGRGQGVPQDFSEALRWYRRAAEQGNAGAQTALGGMYARGEGVPQDFAQAVRWYREAAEQGSVRAQFGLAVTYYNGWGVPQDYVRAYAWLEVAASGGSREALRLRDYLAGRMTPEQIQEGQKLAGELSEKHGG